MLRMQLDVVLKLEVVDLIAVETQVEVGIDMVQLIETHITLQLADHTQLIKTQRRDPSLTPARPSSNFSWLFGRARLT